MPIETPVADKLEKLEKEVRRWSSITRKDLLMQLASLGLEQQSELVKSIRAKLFKKEGDLEGAAFSFIRHGIFFERGVGRGRPVGSSQAAKLAKPWLKPIIPDAVEKLADILVEEYADVAASEVKINIPGIISSKVTR